MASLAERIGQDPEPWKPEPGDTLVGTVIEVTTRESEFGVYPLIGVMTEDGGEYYLHCFHTVLTREIARRRPKIGDTIAVRFRGDHERGYKDYRVLVESPAPPEDPVIIDWEAMEKAAEEQESWEAKVAEKTEAADG